MTAPAGSPAFAGTRRFRPLAVLGRGSMGDVYRVHDAETGSEVALKTLHLRDGDQIYRLKQEFRVLTGITHPNLIELYDLFVDDANAFFTMELIDGITFGDFIARAMRGDPGERALLLAQAARQLVMGLSALHAAGKLHRDIKPGNILTDRNGRIVLLDFGLATLLKAEGPALLDKDMWGGTLAYMAPELAWGKAPTPAGDWYGLGVVLYEALTGRLPFGGRPHEMLRAKERGVPPRPATLVANVPVAIDEIVMAMLRPDPRDRPQSPALLAALAALAPSRAAVPVTVALALRREEIAFVGRREELARLGALFSEVQNGATLAVQIRGPSGIGKSELVRRFVAPIEANGAAIVLRGRCHPQESVPFNALDGAVDALSRFLLATDATEVSDLAPIRAHALLRLFPVLARVPALAEQAEKTGSGVNAEPHELRRWGFEALRTMLERLTRERPAVIWLDDVQWTDLDSAALLRELSRGPAAPRVMWILSYRDEGENALFEMLGADCPITRSETIELRPLSIEESQHLAVQWCKTGTADPQQIVAVIAEAGGSPFLIGELARHALSRGEPGGLSLSEMILERLHELPDPARRLLELVCVAGRPLDRSFALAVAGVGEPGRPLVAHLSNAFLLRTSTVAERPAIEAYHHRISQALLAALTPAQLRGSHGELADALLRDPSPDPEWVFRHTLGAGREEQAAAWAVQAADRAAHALAFARAAELYEQALHLREWATDQTVELREKRADALVNVGRCAEAAPIYLSAAEDARTKSAHLRRRAAEQYLVSGHIIDGVQVLRSLLDELGIAYPRSPGRAFWGIICHLMRLRFRTRGDLETFKMSEPPLPVSTRIDACDSAGKGLVVVDPLRGMYFSVLSLSLAMDAGETRRIVRGICMAGVMLAPLRGPLGRWASGLLARTRAIAETAQDPYLMGITAIATAQLSSIGARWKEMLTRCDSGVDLLATYCRGVTWERNIGRMGALRALEQLGDGLDVMQRAQRWLSEARDTGDLYAQVTARLWLAFWLLATDDPAAARAEARESIRLWTGAATHLQHFYEMRVEAYCALYEQNPRPAWEEIMQMWPTLRRSHLLRDHVLRSDAYLLRAHLALARARIEPDARAGMLRDAEHDARHLGRERRPDTFAHVLLLQAGINYLRGQAAQASAMAGEAAERYAQLDMPLHAACAHHRRAKLVGGEESDVLSRKADAQFARSGVRNPTRWVDLYAPGF